MGKKKQQQQQPRLASGASFFKVMIGDFKRSLEVPPSFTRYIKAQCNCILRSHIFGKSWHVEVKGFANRMLFQTGWGKFVEDHAIGLGEFLVFMYDGESGFNVDVYGIDGCKKDNLVVDSNVELSQEKADAEKAMHPLEYPKKGCSPRKDVLVFGRTKYGPLRLGRRPRRTLKRERELEAALPFKPMNPYFVAIWRSTRANLMTIPHALAQEYKFGWKKFSTRFRDHLGRSWLVKTSLRKDGRVDFTKGWTEFSRDNFLTEGDACVFEFTQAGNVIQTHLLQVENTTGKLVKKSGKVLELEIRGSSIPKIRKIRVTTSAPTIPKKEFSKRQGPLNHTIRRHLVREHDLGVDKSIALHDLYGRTWPVNIHRGPDGRTASTGIKWQAFTRGNSLRDGDACTFKFAKRDDSGKVHLRWVNADKLKQEPA